MEDNIYVPEELPNDAAPEGPEATVEPVREKKLAGIAGAILYSLAAGAIWILLSSFGLFSAALGFVCVVLATNGYRAFSGRQSKFGVIASTAVSAVTLLAAWYLNFVWEVYREYLAAFEDGELFTSMSLGEAFSESFDFLGITLQSAPGYFGPIVLALILAGVGCAVGLSNVKAGRV
ncbi:MAG: hypothetical protein ILO42_06385 [Clostridia bacterium]|nr:hypothetical protein [Clostridia bacterium]MBP5270566.1 hypothetical protein [Clostridia bacterium]